MLLFMSANPRAEQSDSTCMPPFGKEYASRTTWEIQCNRSAHTAQFSIDLNHLGMHFAHSKKWGFTLGQCTRCSTWGSILVPSSREHAVQTRTLPLYRLGSSLAALTCTRANHVQNMLLQIGVVCVVQQCWQADRGCKVPGMWPSLRWLRSDAAPHKESCLHESAVF